MIIYDFKKEYNQLLARERKAENYLNNNSLPLADREKWIPEYEKICKRLNDLLIEIKFYTPENILEGFSEKECQKPDTAAIPERLNINETQSITIDARQVQLFPA